jgi:acetate---CoA ligase (ADP-forming)
MAASRDVASRDVASRDMAASRDVASRDMAASRDVASRDVARRDVAVDAIGRLTALRHVDLDTFFNPKRVAVVGASDTDGRPNTSLTQKITAWAEARGASVHYVNPNRSVVAGRPTVQALTEVEEQLDLVAILVGEPLSILRDAVGTRAKFAVVFAAGFAEVGANGARIQAEMERVIESGDTHVLGPNTNLNAFEMFRDDLPGRAIALITQSGHQGRPVFQGQEIGIKLSHWAPTGNEADLESADFIDYFSNLTSTGAVACYIEGFKNGRTLQLAADAAARRRVPIVAVKVGRTDEGTSMAKAHTGHLTGSDEVVSAVFRQYGIHRVDGLDQLLDVSAALARTEPPSPPALRRLIRGAGGRVCVYAISGGTGAHMADMVAAAGLELPRLSPASQRQLHEWIPPYLRVSNPVDSGGPPVRDWRGPKIVETMLADPNVDLLLCPITGAVASFANKLSEDLVAAAATTDKPLFVVWGSPVGNEEAYTETLLGSTVPTFRTFTNAVMAAKAYFDHHRFAASYRSAFARPVRTPSPARSGAMPTLAPGGARRRSGETLSEQDSKALLAAYGIAVPAERVVTSAAEAAKAAKRLRFPVVMKVVSADIAHKSDLGLVAVGVRDEDDAQRTYGRLMATAKKARPKARIDGAVVAETVPGVETVVGIARDDLFGPVVMFGLGGVLVEVLRDVTFRVPPFTARDAATMLGELRGSALLDGVRGSSAANRAALVDTLMKMQRLAVDLSDDVLEVDVNPLLAGPEGAVAVDALVVTA